MSVKVQFIAPLADSPNLEFPINIYYVRDEFGRVWSTVARDEKEAKQSIYCKEEALTYILYQPEKKKQGHQYDLKNLILGMLEQMELQDTYEYEVVVGWEVYEVFEFIRGSSLQPCDLLLEINKFKNKAYIGRGRNCES